MKFLFVNLDWPGLVSKKSHKIHLALPPLDLILMSNMASAKGHDCNIFDCFIESGNNLDDLIKQADWIIIATTPYHMWQCPNSDWDWIKKALTRFPSNKTILTGLHASVFPERTLRETDAYAVIRREPEVTFLHFLDSEAWHTSPGVSYIQDRVLIQNNTAPLPNMDSFAVKSYCVDINKYGYFLLGKKTGIFEASRGCPWKCTFCDQEMYSWKYRTKSPAIFAEEVARSIEQTGMETAYFYDLEFTVSKTRTLEICKELVDRKIQNKIRWCCQTRADTIDSEILDALKEAGCVLIHFGVESANSEILKATNKRITLDKIEEGVKLTKSKGIQTACFFMFGLPRETPCQFDNTLEFARNLNPTYASFHFAVPFPGTPLYEQYLKEKNLTHGVWPATYFDTWKHEEITRYLGRAYKKFYLTPKKFDLREFRFRLGNLRHKLQYFKSVS